ncbi:unnamed protein product [Blepharisma stoltei]|uniref:Uncharacterized protein n=1 Tax=Blepharisma stoltei TaxID=1481888 RepID=A0AAU9JR17_9CILI|nr:unnamed protein product [Blepharisma stoltei]
METESERSISESEVSQYLSDFTSESLKLIKSSQVKDAYKVLKSCEELLEAVASQGGCIDPDMILLTLHNCAYCCQKLQNYEECASYLDGCAYNASVRNILASKDESQSEPSHYTEKIRKERYQCKLQTQICAIMSHVNKHDLALNHAKEALKFGISFMQNCSKACQYYTVKNTKLPNYIRQKRNNDQSSGKTIQQQHDAYLGDLVKKNSHIFEFLLQKINGKSNSRATSAKVPKLDLRSILGVQHYNDWIYKYEISDVLTIDPITPTDVKTPLGLIGELNRDLMLEKICLIAVVCYCMATELRFLYQTDKSELKRTESNVWYFKAYEIIKDLIPSESPLYQHIKQSYQFYMNKEQKLQNKTQDSSFTSRGKSPLKDKSIEQIYSRSSSASKYKKKIPITKRDITPARTKTPIFARLDSKNEQIGKGYKQADFGYEFQTDRNQKPKAKLSQGEHSKSDNSIKYKKKVNKKHLNLEDFVTGELINKKNSDESYDSDYIRDNFVLSSQELYGENPDDSANNARNLKKFESIKSNLQKKHISPLYQIFNEDLKKESPNNAVSNKQ